MSTKKTKDGCKPRGERADKRLPSLAEFRASITVKGKPLSEIVIENRRAERY